MTRKEQIDTAASRRANQFTHPVEWNEAYCKFREGAEWADNHPDWRDVNNELPEPDDGGRYSDDVLIDIYGDVYSGCYDHKGKYWVIYVLGENRIIADDETYWMPLPKPLKKDY